MHALGKNLKLFNCVLLINVNEKMKKFNLTNKCTVCEKGHFYYPFSHTVHLFVIFLNFTLILRFFSRAWIHICKKNNLRLQGLQIEAFQQRYSKCYCLTPYLKGELVPKTCKNWKMFSKSIFLSGLVTKLENLFVF